MYPLKFIIVLITVVVILEAKDKMKQKKEIFKKCAEANGLNMRKMKEMKMNESRKKNGKSGGSTEGISKEFLCTQKCVWEEKEFLSKTTIDIEKVKNSESAKKFIKEENMDAYLKCIKPLKIENCEDFKKIFECNKAISSKS